MRPLLLLPLLFVLAATGSILAQPYDDPDNSEFKARNLEDVNSGDDDYSPYITPNGQWLYFTSSRNGSSGIYRSRRMDGRWVAPEYAGEVTRGRDEGSFSAPIPPLAELFDLDDDALKFLRFDGIGVLTSGNRPGGVGDADLYLIDISRDGIKLDNVQLMRSVSTSDWDAQGAVAPDRSFMIFSSNRPGGVGDMDLYIARLDSNGNYSDPVNMGLTINTTENEFAPFIAPDGRTLFFASTGHGGFGGSDLFMSRRDSYGTWSTPRNLGQRINSSYNELFFFGVGPSRCYFTSDRPGGKGGLDIYEASPNIFASAYYSTVNVSIIDTTTGKRIAGRIKVTETTLGRMVAEVNIPEGGGELHLFTGASYRVEASSPGYPATAAEVLRDLPEGESTPVTLALRSIPPQPQFSFNKDNIRVPWFVSGYYRINTSELLADLRDRQQKGEFDKEAYITSVAKDTATFDMYKADAGKVEAIINDFYQNAVNQYFPIYLKWKKPEEHLDIVVYAFADPRRLVGVYREKPMTFYDEAGTAIEVRPGDALDNFKLAGLRAAYAAEYLDMLFRKAAANGHGEYQTLLDRGLIRWRPVSGNVDMIATEDVGQMRRVKVDFQRIDPGK